MPAPGSRRSRVRLPCSVQSREVSIPLAFPAAANSMHRLQVTLHQLRSATIDKTLHGRVSRARRPASHEVRSRPIDRRAASHCSTPPSSRRASPVQKSRIVLTAEARKRRRLLPPDSGERLIVFRIASRRVKRQRSIPRVDQLSQFAASLNCIASQWLASSCPSRAKCIHIRCRPNLRAVLASASAESGLRWRERHGIPRTLCPNRTNRAGRVQAAWPSV